MALKTRTATKELLKEHYNELVDKPFFPKLRDYMLSGPVRTFLLSFLNVSVSLHTHMACRVCFCCVAYVCVCLCDDQVVSMVWEGKEAVSTGRKMLGATNPLESAPGTIRGDYCIEVGRNVFHGSDSVENAEREISLWFDAEKELLDWTSHSQDWIYE